MGNLKYVGKSVVRQDGLEKITGAAQYVDDLDFGQHLLYAAIVESPHANAEILKINIKKAQGLEGVVRVVTGDEFPYRFGLYMHDRYIFAQQRVRFVGEQVAAVIARTPEIAYQAAKLVEVKYKVLKPVLSVHDALGVHQDFEVEKNNMIHPDLSEYK